MTNALFSISGGPAILQHEIAAERDVIFYIYNFVAKKNKNVKYTIVTSFDIDTRKGRRRDYYYYTDTNVVFMTDDRKEKSSYNIIYCTTMVVSLKKKTIQNGLDIVIGTQLTVYKNKSVKLL